MTASAICGCRPSRARPCPSDRHRPGGFVDGEPIEGLVIDVRSASLGALGVTLALLSHITEGSPGTLYSRTETSPLELPDSGLRAALSEVPIALLVDDGSAGEAERLALMLQALGRATVVARRHPVVSGASRRCPSRMARCSST